MQLVCRDLRAVVERTATAVKVVRETYSLYLYVPQIETIPASILDTEMHPNLRYVRHCLPSWVADNVYLPLRG